MTATKAVVDKTGWDSYELNVPEVKARNKFQKKHWKKCKGGVSVTFQGTGIGTLITVTCSKCNKIKDISDYSCW